MKKTFILLGVLLSSVFGYGENKIQMVTYFPVPYVAYSKVNVNKQMDVGLTNTCAMNLGCNESGSAGLKPLQATTVNLNRGKLDLNTGAAALSTSVTMGSGAGTVEMNFGQDLRIGTLNNAYSIETDQMTVDVLKLFPSRIKNDFPSCASTGASGAPQVSWQQLKLKDKEETYLVCGSPKEEERCQPTHNGQETYTAPCPTWQTGSITYTWDYNLCTYRIQSSCTAAYKKCLSTAMYCGGADVSRGAINDGACGGTMPGADASIRYPDCSSLKRGGGWFDLYNLSTDVLFELQQQGYERPGSVPCTPGTECDACTPGKKYLIQGTKTYGHPCTDTFKYLYGPGSCRTLYIFNYALCEMRKDCSEGTTAVCDSWSKVSSGGTGLIPWPDDPKLIQ